MSELDQWNTLGRNVARRNSEQITAFHEGRIDRPNLVEDTRNPDLAQAVLAEVVALNASGRGAEARDFFDPAHAPFIPELEKGGRGLKGCAILGEDDFLVQQGTPWQQTTTWRISNNRFHKVENVAGFAWSRNRAHFVTLYRNGSMTIGTSFDSDVARLLPAPTQDDFVPKGLPDSERSNFKVHDGSAIQDIAISDDGRKVLLTDADRGVLLLNDIGESWETHLLYPSLELDLRDHLEDWFGEMDDPYSPAFDMLHSALSPDGAFAALGTQDVGHYIVDISASPELYAKLGHLSEYPHHAVFSDDSQVVAFNSCHFYNGATFASRIGDVKGMTTDPCEQASVQTLLNAYLRVYAAGFVPAAMTPNDESGAFLLAGSGFAACVTPNGKLLWEVGFGSSAGDVDVCPNTGRVLLASYSGMLHLFDPKQSQDVPILEGYNVPKELKRWVFWDRLARPLIW